MEDSYSDFVLDHEDAVEHNNFLVIVFGLRRNVKYFRRHNSLFNAYTDYKGHFDKFDFYDCDDREIKKNQCEFLDGGCSDGYGVMYLYKLNDNYANDMYVKFCNDLSYSSWHKIEISPNVFNVCHAKDKVLRLVFN